MPTCFTYHVVLMLWNFRKFCHAIIIFSQILINFMVCFNVRCKLIKKFTSVKIIAITEFMLASATTSSYFPLSRRRITISENSVNISHCYSIRPIFYILKKSNNWWNWVNIFTAIFFRLFFYILKKCNNWWKWINIYSLLQHQDIFLYFKKPTTDEIELIFIYCYSIRHFFYVLQSLMKLS